MVARVGARCDSCGYRAGGGTAFRRESGGVFRRAVTVCLACEPYAVTPQERRAITGGVATAVIVGVAIAMLVANNGSNRLAAILFAASLAIGAPLAILAHELGHALAGYVTGFRVLRITIGRGPVAFRARLGGAWLLIGRYVHVGGLTQGVRLDGWRPWRQAAFLMGGVAANVAVMLGLFVLGSLLNIEDGSLGGEAIVVLGGLGIMQGLTALSNLVPSRSLDGHPSDGRQLAELVRLRGGLPEGISPPLFRAVSLLMAEQFEALAALSREVLAREPAHPMFLSLLIFAHARVEGEDAALALVRDQRESFEAGIASEDPAHEPYIAALKANFAWWLRTVGEHEIAERLAREAVEAMPQEPELIGILGIVLEAAGRSEAARPLLLEGVRRARGNHLKAQYARRLSDFERRAGNDDLATAFEAIAGHIETAGPLSTGSARA